MQTVWTQFSHPILVLAPMEGVTDTVFRQIVTTTARPDICMTEFTSVEGYFSPGRERVAESLRFIPSEHPLIAQVWGNVPEHMEEMAREIVRLGFVGIDINMGCPDRNVMAHGCGASLIETPELVKELIAGAKRGTGGTIPVSVKTRLGKKSIQTDTWIPFLLEQGIDALTIHGRTAKELSKVPAHWDEIGKAVEIRHRMKVATKIIGNGDVKDAKEAASKVKEYGVDGVMIGRGIFENMWAFDRSEHPHVPGNDELFDLMRRHITLFTQTWGTTKNYAILKKYYKIYIKGFDGASEVRDQVMQTENAQEALNILTTIEEHYGV